MKIQGTGYMGVYFPTGVYLGRRRGVREGGRAYRLAGLNVRVGRLKREHGALGVEGEGLGRDGLGHCRTESDRWPARIVRLHDDPLRHPRPLDPLALDHLWVGFRNVSICQIWLTIS